MGLKLTKAEVAHQCRNVTPAMRQFCAEHMNWPDWPEHFLHGANKNPGESPLDAEPFTEAQWWEIINERVVTPGESSSCEAQ